MDDSNIEKPHVSMTARYLVTIAAWLSSVGLAAAQSDAELVPMRLAWVH